MSSLVAAAEVVGAVVGAMVGGAASTEEKRVWPVGKRLHMFNSPSQTHTGWS